MLCSTAISGGKCRLPVINCRAAYKPSCLLFPQSGRATRPPLRP